MFKIGEKLGVRVFSPERDDAPNSCANDNYRALGKLRVRAPSASRQETAFTENAMFRRRPRGTPRRVEEPALDTVPDPSMMALCAGLVSFLSQEAQERGWTEIATRLRSVEQALTGQAQPAARQQAPG
jgi:hypothetical protein